jgi:hypothetical protein
MSCCYLLLLLLLLLLKIAFLAAVRAVCVRDYQ